jgi:hypothetical protein
MPIENKPQHGDPLVGDQLGGSGFPAKAPFQQFLDSLVQLVNGSEEGLTNLLAAFTAHVENEYAHRPNLMNWRGTWAGGFYQYNDVVVDDDYTMICINPKGSTDRPAPQPVGTPFNVYTGSSPTTNTLAKQIMSGNRYSIGASGYLIGYRVYTVAGNFYTVSTVADPLGSATIRQLVAFTATTTGWRSFSLNNNINAGVVFDLIVIAQEPDPTPTTFQGNWDYTTPQNTTAPIAGQITHARSETGVMNVSKTDSDGGNRSVDLAGLTVGDIIEGAGIRWAIQSITDLGAYYAYGVSPATNGGPIGVQQFIFETETATPITYVEDVNYWPTSPYPTVEGIIAIDTGYFDATINDNAYGVDITVQEGTASPDWGSVAYSGT